MSIPRVHHDPKARTFTLDEGGTSIGLLQYEEQGGEILATHTEVDGAFGGRGYGRLLVDALADWARGEGRRIQPCCSYVVHLFDKAPDKYGDVDGR